MSYNILIIHILQRNCHIIRYRGRYIFLLNMTLLCSIVLFNNYWREIMFLTAFFTMYNFFFFIHIYIFLYYHKLWLTYLAYIRNGKPTIFFLIYFFTTNAVTPETTPYFIFKNVKHMGKV